jgi:DNA-directed RNA polymerase specialized sigma24 family protein
MTEHRGRKPKTEVREKVNRLHIAGYSYEEIAETLGLSSRQLARYYVKTVDKKK